MRNNIIDNLRGFCMLGVLGIHIGSLALTPNNFSLYCILEILSRYSVPTFFFISGYGLCCTDKNLLKNQPFNYFDFIKKRLRSAALPYLSWSFFYMFYFWLILPKGFISWEPLHIIFVLFFGLGCYHLYFMVILLWFYLTYPLWRYLLQFIIKHNIALSMSILFTLQLAFNWWTTHPNIDVSSLNIVLSNLFQYRLNYLPIHYFLVFTLGCLAAIYWDKFTSWMRRKSIFIVTIYIISLIYYISSAYHAFYQKGYSLLDLANTYHQLSPQGLVYTLTSILFFCWVLDKLAYKTSKNKYLHILQSAINTLANYSMLIYFIHPLILDWMSSFYNHFQIVMTVKKVSFSYLILLITSLYLSIILTKLLKKFSILNLLFTGKK